MIRAAWRDLQWRKRRFAIAVGATGLVFALSLLLAGVSASFGREAGRTLRSIGADAWLVRDGAPGPFTSFAPLRASWAQQLIGGSVRAADAVLVIHQTVRRTNHAGHLVSNAPFRDVTLFGVNPAGVGAPHVARGHGLQTDSDAVVDAALGYAIGDEFAIGPRVVTVVGVTHGNTLFAGLANVFVSLDTAQALFADTAESGQVANTIAVRGTITAPVAVAEPAGSVPLTLLTNNQVRADVLRPLSGARDTINLVRLLLWIAAACIVASVVYVTALERARDFAVFKATGTSTTQILVGLVTQALVLALAAGVVAVAASAAMRPAFPVPIAVPNGAYLALAVLAVVVGLVASLGGVRRVVAIEPVTAFAGP